MYALHEEQQKGIHSQHVKTKHFSQRLKKINEKLTSA